MLSQKIVDRAGLETPTVDRIVLQVRTAQSVPFAGYMTGEKTPVVSTPTLVPFPSFMTTKK